MKSAALALWASLIFASSAAAQAANPPAGSPESRSGDPSQAQPLSANEQSESVNVAQILPAARLPDGQGQAGFGPEGLTAYAEAVTIPTTAESAGEPSSSAHQPVYGVLPASSFEVYGGFTYFRFYEVPGVTGNLAGFNISLVYYPHAGHLGADGEFAVGFASQAGSSTTTTLEAGMGGGRFRITTPRNTEVWVHALAGGAHFIPKTPYGSQGAFAFEAGGGADWSPHGGPFAFRAQADLLGTYFFSTHQYGPKLSVGVVYNF